MLVPFHKCSKIKWNPSARVASWVVSQRLFNFHISYIQNGIPVLGQKVLAYSTFNSKDSSNSFLSSSNDDITPAIVYQDAYSQSPMGIRKKAILMENKGKGGYPSSILSKFRLNTQAIRNYSSQSDADSLHSTPRSRVLAEILGKNPIFYEDSYKLKQKILEENKSKSGIYMWTNKITGDIYIGQSVNLANRLKRYFNENYLEKNKSFLISRALMKYGHSAFSLTILEYCDKSKLNEREQYYLDNLEPDYNILKYAGSFLGYTFTEESRAKISKALKGINRSEETKDLMREKALGRKHS